MNQEENGSVENVDLSENKTGTVESIAQEAVGEYPAVNSPITQEKAEETAETIMVESVGVECGCECKAFDEIKAAGKQLSLAEWSAIYGELRLIEACSDVDFAHWLAMTLEKIYSVIKTKDNSLAYKRLTTRVEEIKESDITEEEKTKTISEMSARFNERREAEGRSMMFIDILPRPVAVPKEITDIKVLRYIFRLDV